MSNSTPQWLFYAISSGGCAALNGVFAKLTTTQLTTTWATGISRLFGMDRPSRTIELLIRIVSSRCGVDAIWKPRSSMLTDHQLFFSLNLAFNGVMWGLFTRALTLGNSTVQVSVINTSANFVITALLGALVFSEDLPGRSSSTYRAKCFD